MHIIPLFTLLFSPSTPEMQKMSNDFSFFLTYTQAVALKGENVSFELVLAGERWLTLMQNRREKKKKNGEREIRKKSRERKMWYEDRVEKSKTEMERR